MTNKEIQADSLRTYNLQSGYGDIQIYLNAWTKSNMTLSNEYILKYKYSPRVSVFYGYNDQSAPICLTTKGMSWQDLQRWTLQNCSVNDTNILEVDVQTPAVLTMDAYPHKTL